MTGETYRSGKLTVHHGERVWVSGDGTFDAKPNRVAAEASYLCANCDTRFRSALPLPYCSLACKSQAKTVRAFRSAFATYGRAALPEDVAQALRMIKMAHALAGGYDSAVRYLSRAAREHIVERDRGRCVLCSSPGSEIDHICGDSPDPANLRLLCDTWHVGITCRTAGTPRPSRTMRTTPSSQTITGRVDSPTPMRACDTAEG